MLRISRKKILICMYHNLLSCSPSLNSFFSSSLHKKTKKRKELILADLFPNASCMPIIFDNLNLKYQLARMNTTNTSTISKRRIYFSPYYVLAIFSMFYIYCIANFIEEHRGTYCTPFKANNQPYLMTRANRATWIIARILSFTI